MRLIADLYDYALRNGLGQTPFVERKMTARLNLDSDGKVSLFTDDQTYSVPFIQRTVQVASNPFYDQAAYVLGKIPEGKSETYAQARFQDFWETTQRLLGDIGEEDVLRAVQKLKASPDALQKLAKEAPEGWIALAFEGELIATRPRVQTFFQERFSKTSSSGGDLFCLLTGVPCSELRLHDKIDGVPGTGGGVPLISFHAPSTTQKGLKQGLNFPMSFSAMKAYTGALNSLIKTTMARLSDNACVVFWGPGASHFRTVADLYAKSEDKKAAFEGLKEVGSGDLHILFLKGSQGRIAILGYNTRPAKEVVADLHRLRKSLSQARRRSGFFTSEAKDTFGLGSSILRLAEMESAKRGEVPSILRVEVYRSVLTGSPMPKSFVRHLLRSQNVKQVVNGSVAALTQIGWLEFSAILKANPKAEDMERQFGEEPDITKFVNEDESDAYLMGRLVALSVALKRQAHSRVLSDDGAHLMLTRAQRCPGNFYAQHVALFTIHESKTGRNGRHRKFVNLINEVSVLLKNSAFVSQTTPLSLTQKAMLNQGFMHQRAFNIDFSKYRKELAEKKAKEEAETPSEAAAE